MTYLLTQLWFCLLLAWMLGNIVGWLLRGGCSEHIKRVEKNWRERYLELEKEKEGYRVKLKKLTKKDQDRNSLIEQLQRFQGIEVANSKLKARLKLIENKAVALHGEAKSRGQSLLGLRDSVTASKKIITSKERDLKSLADKLTTSVNQINSFKSQYQEVKEKYENKISDQESQLQELRQQLDKTNAQVEKASKESLGKHQEEQTKLTQKLDDSSKELGKHKQLLEKSNAENTQLKQKMTGVEGRMEMLVAEFSKMATQNVEAKSEIERLKSSAGVKQDGSEPKLALKEVETYKARLKEKEQENKSLQARLDTANTQVEKVSKPALDKKQEGQPELTQKTNGAAKESEGYKQRLEKSDEANAKLKAKMTGIEGRMEMLVAEFSKMATQNVEAKAEIERLKSSAGVKQDGSEPKLALKELETYKARLEEKEQENKSLKARLDTANTQVEKASKAPLDKGQEEKPEHTQKTNGAAKELESYKQRLGKSDEANAKLKSKMTGIEGRMEMLVAEFSKMATQHMEAKAEVERLRSSANVEQDGSKPKLALKEAETYKARLKEKEQENKSLQARLDTANKQVEKTSKAPLDNAAKELENHKRLLEKSDGENAKLKTKMSAVEERMEVLVAEFSKMATQLMHAQAEVEKAKSLSVTGQDSSEAGSKEKQPEVDEGEFKGITAKLEKEQKKNSKQKEKINKLSIKLDKSRSKLVEAHKRLQEIDSDESSVRSSTADIQSFVSSEVVDENSPAKNIVNGEVDSEGNSRKNLAAELKQSKQKVKSLEDESAKNNKLIQKLERQAQGVGRESIDASRTGEGDSQQALSTKYGATRRINLLVGDDYREGGSESAGDQEDIIPVNCEIEEIRGIGPGYGMRLRKLGISTNQDLLRKISSSKDVKSIAEKLSRKPAEILSWRKMADFLTIEGMSSEFAKLLELSNINSAEELGQSNTTVLAEKMAVAKKKERRIHNTPDTEEIGEWISNAKRMNVK